ncbi:MAG: hypothetical protein M1608_16270 [Candidatus Omnitrophica bacterium]|nr:hypothetical protein [Candidatus Omnitrophota bacterium]
MTQPIQLALTFVLFLSANLVARPDEEAPTLPGTEPLRIRGDIASNLVAGVDRFLLRKIDESLTNRDRFWKRDFSSPENYSASINSNRQHLAHILGARDPRIPFKNLEFIQPGPERVPLDSDGGLTAAENEAIAAGRHYTVYNVRWPAFGDVHGDGLLLIPLAATMEDAAARKYHVKLDPAATMPGVIAVPDADQTPEQISGLEEGVPPESQFARILADSGCLVLVPVLVNRGTSHGRLSNREYIYRSAFELGRHIIGYEIEKALAAVDWLEHEKNLPARDKDAADSPRPGSHLKLRISKIGVIGWGEGGMLALYAGALDPRIDAVCVSGYFDSRQDVWQEPVYRNVFGLLEQFGDAELAGMIAPRPLVIEAARGPELVVPPGTGGAPGRLATPELSRGQQEVARARQWLQRLQPPPSIELVVSGDGHGPFGTREALERFSRALDSHAPVNDLGKPSYSWRQQVDSEARQQSQIHELDRHSQWLLSESPYVRQQFMAKLDTSSPANYAHSLEWYRDFFYQDVIGRFDCPLLPSHVRTRLAYDTPKWTGYEVVMDVFPEVIAYGILLLPKDLHPGEKRPVVVCQHGLEGRPQDVVTGNSAAYHDFAARLAELGFITFAPQNLYIFGDRFRTLQRKANPLKKTLFSIIVPQHQQITDWLKSLDCVDGGRIGFYGLSYGGKSAMRIPALVTNYCLSICSGDFNEWVWKNASTRSPYSYIRTGEYEIFEFDLGSTFNYAEMAALIAPRPFMVERGHFDAVAPDETVGYEFAKVRFLYEARLGLKNQAEIEWFVGPHTINGKGTFDFLRHHLDWPESPSASN